MANTKFNQNILLRSTEVSEILSHKPGFMVRWGIAVLLFVLLLLFVSCWFIQYPDLVTAKAKLNCVNAPKEIITHTKGRLTKILIKQNELVQENQVLAHIESLANIDAVLRVGKQVDTISNLIKNKQTQRIISFFPNQANHLEFNQLGELQNSYQLFIQSFITFKDFLHNGFYIQKKEKLLTDLKNTQKLHAILISQKELLQKDFQLANETFKANESLARDKVISAMDYRNEESKLLIKKLTLPQIDYSIVVNESQQNEKIKEIAELENQIKIEQKIFIQALQTMKSELIAWEFKFLIKATSSGIVTFTHFFQENQEVQLGQSLFYIEPINANYFLEVLLPQYNSGKVKKGQKVLLKFFAYPYEQYGVVEGVIDFISNIPSDSGFLAKVSLPKGFITNYQKPLQYRNGLLAQADIITANRNLLERFYTRLTKQINR